MTAQGAAVRAGRLGLPHPRQRGLRRTSRSGHVSARDPGEPQCMWIKRKGVALDEVEPDDVIEFVDRRRPARTRRTTCTSRRCCTPRSTGRAPDVGAVVHGHPPYATALGATDAKLALLTHDAVLFADGLAASTGAPGADHRAASRARRWPTALGERPVRPAAQPRRARRGQGRPWAVLAAVTLERAVQAPVDRGHSRRAAADRRRRGRRAAARDKYQRRVPRGVLGTPGCASCAARGLDGRHGGLDVAEAPRAARQRHPARAGRCRAAGAAARLPARPARPDRGQALVRRPGLRRLHGARRRRAGERVLHARLRGRGPRGPDDRGVRASSPSSPSSRRRSSRHAALQCGFCTPRHSCSR